MTTMSNAQYLPLLDTLDQRRIVGPHIPDAHVLWAAAHPFEMMLRCVDDDIGDDRLQRLHVEFGMMGLHGPYR